MSKLYDERLARIKAAINLEPVDKVPLISGLAAAAAAWMMGIPGEAVAHGLESFHGAGRRMEFKGQWGGADFYDDYAHHPDEVAATIDAVRASMPGRRLVLAGVRRRRLGAP